MSERIFVDEATIEAFRKDGAVPLRGLFTDWIDTLQAGVEKNLAAPSADVRIYEGSGGRFFGDYCNWGRIPEYRDFVFHSPAAKVAQRLMGSKTVRLFHEHVLVKEPGADVPTPWHHDQPYYCVDGRQNVSLWVTLDAVARDTVPEFIAGSHAWGRWFQPERFNRTPLFTDDRMEQIPDIEAERDKYRILGWDLEPGDAVAFHFLTLHGAPANDSKSRRRRAVSTRWLGDDAVFAQRKGVTSPPFRGLTLKPGDAMEAPEFPLVIGG
jgi:ectoine hydroxylase-related dioxygenase (phytanoyl-CoA dioxygenase family)